MRVRLWAEVTLPDDTDVVNLFHAEKPDPSPFKLWLQRTSDWKACGAYIVDGTGPSVEIDL